MVQIQPQSVAVLSAITATATSVWIPVQSAGRVSLMFTGTTITSGNCVYTVQVSNDSTVGFVPYNRLTTNTANTNAQTDVRVASVTVNSNTSTMVFIPASDTFSSFRVIGTVTTDGVYSAVAYVN